MKCLHYHRKCWVSWIAIYAGRVSDTLMRDEMAMALDQERRRIVAKSAVVIQAVYNAHEARKDYQAKHTIQYEAQGSACRAPKLY